MRVLITGGAGFIGCNTAVDLLGRGDEVVILDNLSRVGAEQNLEWVLTQGDVDFIEGDVRDPDATRRAVDRSVDAVIHLAAQVAVTSSVADPRHDFEVNALGTINVLEAVRAAGGDAIVIFASSNKVYGALEDMACTEQERRYTCAASGHGVDESRPLDLHSPYGCSKGAADQYVHDYSRIYGMRTVVLRQSCIYGPRQFGVEDQGWLAWFALAALTGKPITIYGEGKQVRDVLEISDLVRLYRLCIDEIEAVSGRILNIGGGPDNTVSILESLARLEELLGRKIERRFSAWRPGDQKIFISCNELAGRLLGWRPEVDLDQGLGRLLGWIQPNMKMIQALVG